jgi:hypothetical protein
VPAPTTHSYPPAQPYRPASSTVVVVTAPLTPMAPLPHYVYVKPATMPANQQYYYTSTSSKTTVTTTTTSRSGNNSPAAPAISGQPAPYVVSR